MPEKKNVIKNENKNEKKNERNNTIKIDDEVRVRGEEWEREYK